MALAAFAVAQGKPHLDRFSVCPGEELQGIEAGHRPHPQAHSSIGAAVTGDAAHLVLALLVQSGEVGWLGRPQALELLVVEMAGNAEPVVALLGSEPGEEKQDKEGSDDEASERQRPASRERTNGRRAFLLAMRFSAR